MGGEITVKSKLGSGSCFSLKIPTKEVQDQAITDNTEKEKPIKQLNIPKDIKLLVVEDNLINREVITTILDELDLPSDIAENGQQAIDMLQNNQANYALVLMDCQMPIMDGYQATHAIRNELAEDKHTSIPIIAMTANAMKGDREKCLGAGMNDYITKPIDIEILIKTLKEWLPHDNIKPL